MREKCKRERKKNNDERKILVDRSLLLGWVLINSRSQSQNVVKEEVVPDLAEVDMVV